MNSILLSYPTISDMLSDWFGLDIPLPIQTYGFFVGMAFLAGAYVLSHEFKYKESIKYVGPVIQTRKIGVAPKLSDHILMFVLTALIMYKAVYMVLHYRECVDNIQEFLLSGRGNLSVALLIAAGWTAYSWYSKNKEKLDKPKEVTEEVLPHKLAGNILMVTGLFGILGAKIFHNLENFDRFLADPIGEFFSFSGLTFFGGLIVGGLAGYIYLRKNKINGIHTLDCAAPAIAAGYALGRVGCQVSGDGCWGCVNNSSAPSFIPDWAWSSKFPHNVVNEGIKLDNCDGRHCAVLSQGVWPTSLYESIMMIFIAAVLIFLARKVKLPGVVFSIYLILQGIERMTIEQIRVNNKFNLFSLEVTQAEVIATILMICGVAGCLLIYKYRDKIMQKSVPSSENVEVANKQTK